MSLSIKKKLFTFKSLIYRSYYYFLYKKKIKELKNKKKINVSFLISNITQWKYNSLYIKFKDNEKFIPTIYVVPDIHNINNPTSKIILNKTFDILKKDGANVINGFDKNKDLKNIYKKIYKSDIVFFSRVTEWGSKFSLERFKNSLTCYVPYSIHVDKNNFLQVGQLFYQCLWVHYLPIKKFLDTAKEIYPAKNCKILGYPGLDPFINKSSIIIDQSIKKWTGKKTKFIWAPHHTIEEDDDRPFFSTFLIYAQKMLELLNDTEDKIEICFKPHPGLKEKLYKHLSWGKYKTDEYYNNWSKSKNGILHESIYHDVFMSADAMLLDSISFMTEFSFIEKPICFLTRYKKQDYDKYFNNVGITIFNSLQKASSWNEIKNFVDQVEKNKTNKNILQQKNCFVNLEISKTKKSSDLIFDNISGILSLKYSGVKYD